MIAAVLVGGKSSRFGRDKLSFKIGRRSVLEETLSRVKKAERIEDVVLVSSKGGKDFEDFGLEVIKDPYSCGPLGGIVYSLETLGDCFILGGDMPFILPEFVDMIVEGFIRSMKEICIPKWENGYLEPLHAAYSAKVLPNLKRKLMQGERSVVKAIMKMERLEIPLWLLTERYRRSLFNLNSLKDLSRITSYLDYN